MRAAQAAAESRRFPGVDIDKIHRIRMRSPQVPAMATRGNAGQNAEADGAARREVRADLCDERPAGSFNPAAKRKRRNPNFVMGALASGKKRERISRGPLRFVFKGDEREDKVSPKVFCDTCGDRASRVVNHRRLCLYCPE